MNGNSVIHPPNEDRMNDLLAPEEFPFPFPPYDIQRDFMRALFDVLEKGQLGIFESPTGTVNILFLFLLYFNF